MMIFSALEKLIMQFPHLTKIKEIQSNGVEYVKEECENLHIFAVEIKHSRMTK